MTKMSTIASADSIQELRMPLLRDNFGTVYTHTCLLHKPSSVGILERCHLGHQVFQ